MVKYNPLTEGVPEGTSEGKGQHLIVYPELSPHTDSLQL